MFKRVTARVAAFLALAALTTIFVTAAASGSALARANSPTVQASASKFLTLPFTDPRITVSQGWIYDWGEEHRGVDYMLGDRSTTNWLPFDVVAAADGWACGNCTSRQGNAIWIKHQINGQTYFTYYGHLAAIEDAIPIGNQQNTVWVHRGQKIGVSGMTGANVIHLHFQVNIGNTIVDPYDLWTMRDSYYPGCQICNMGDNYLWTTNPPSTVSSGPPPLPTEVAPTVPPVNTPVPTRVVPTATPKPVKPPCSIDFEQTVEGAVSDQTPETKYCFTGSAGDWVNIQMFVVDGSDLDTYVKLYGPDGNLIAVDDDGAQIGSNSFIVKQLTQSGPYSIGATRYSGTGRYRLRLEKGVKSALGDLNRDCVVNQSDIKLLTAALGTNDPNADLNLDGVVDSQDRLIQEYRLGRGCMFFTK